MSMKIAIFGFGTALYKAIQKIADSDNYQKDNILVLFDPLNDNQPVGHLCDQLSISYLVDSPNNVLDSITKFSPDIILSAYCRHILKDEIIHAAKLAAVNMHPSLLPDYKGCFSGSWAILNGEKYTGITFHKMTSRVDEGRILFQERTAISDIETAYSLYHRQIDQFINHLDDVLIALTKTTTWPIKQTPSLERYYPRKVPLGGVIKANETSFDFASKFVRALYFPPYPAAKFKTKDKVISCSNLEELSEIKHEFKNL